MSRQTCLRSLTLLAVVALTALLPALPLAPGIAHAAPASTDPAPVATHGRPSSPLPPFNRTWTVEPSSSPGNYFNTLSGVSGVSANDIWAVGCVDTCQHTLIEHWNGTQWSIVPSPDAPDSYSNTLSGVAAVAANDVWAVGTYDPDTDGIEQTLVEHWDGAQWSAVSSPNIGGYDYLFAITVVQPAALWAVGQADVGHYQTLSESAILGMG